MGEETQCDGFGFQNFNKQSDPNKTRAEWQKQEKQLMSMLFY